MAPVQPERPDPRPRRSCRRGTRWSTAPRATGPPARASSGRRSTPPSTSSSRWSSSSRTTATPSRCRSRSTPRAGRSRRCWPASRACFIQEVDGCDPLASYDVVTQAVEYARARKGPALVHAHVIRPYSHSLSDDEVQYRPAAEREEEAARDPVVTFPKYLVAQGIATEAEIEQIRQQVEDEVAGRHRHRAGLAAAGHRHHLPLRLLPRRGPHLRAVRHRGRSALQRRADHHGGPAQRLHEGRDDAATRGSWSSARTSPTSAARQYLGQVKGKGGVFKVTWGLQKQFGGDRVYNSPLAEANIVGRAIGLATRGLKPVVEIQFFDYIWPAYMQIRDELAIMRWRSNNAFAAPVVIRVTYGGYLKGGGALPLADRRLGLHQRAGPAGDLPGHRARRQRPAPHRDPVRGPGALPRAQAPLPPDLQQGAVSRPQLHDPLRQGEGGARRAPTSPS